MTLINKNALRAEMVRNGMSQCELANCIGISSRTFWSRMKKGVFGSDEIEKIVKVLKIKNPMEIFFTDVVS